MADITEKQMLKLYRQVCRLQADTVSKIRADIKDWRAVCDKNGWPLSRVLQTIEHDCDVCQTRCAVRSADLRRLQEGKPHRAQETLKSLDYLDQL